MDTYTNGIMAVTRLEFKTSWAMLGVSKAINTLKQTSATNDKSSSSTYYTLKILLRDG